MTWFNFIGYSLKLDSGEYIIIFSGGRFMEIVENSQFKSRTDPS